MTEKEALDIVGDFFAAVESCGHILTTLEVDPEIYKALRGSEQIQNDRLWSAKLIISERPGLKSCYVREVLKPEDISK